METVVNQETAVDAGACIEDFTSIGEVITAGELWQTTQRHEVIRTGAREPIPSHVRAAVWYRDRGECDHCHYESMPPGQPIHLDHIQPWSSGGPDTTDNLRLLCEYHNLRRSNFVDFARPKMPVTWWCLRCYFLDEHHWTYEDGLANCPIHAWSNWNGTGGRCRVARRYYEARKAGEPATWHERPMLEDGHLRAFCAHCNLPGMTAVVL